MTAGCSTLENFSFGLYIVQWFEISSRNLQIGTLQDKRTFFSVSNCYDDQT